MSHKFGLLAAGIAAVAVACPRVAAAEPVWPAAGALAPTSDALATVYVDVSSNPDDDYWGGIGVGSVSDAAQIRVNVMKIGCE